MPISGLVDPSVVIISNKLLVWMDSDSDDGSDQDNHNHNSAYAKTKKAALEILEGGRNPEDVPSKGLFGLPFMQKALKKRREEAQLDAQHVLNQLEGAHGE